MAYPSAPPVYRGFSAPPRMHWGIVLVLSIVTFGIFGMIWMVIQAIWVKKVTKDSKPFGWCLAYLLSLPVLFVVAIAGGATLGYMHKMDILQEFVALLRPVTRIVVFVLYLFAAYTLKGALERQPIDIPLSGVMTFFLGATYFQYHLFDYNVEGRVAEQLNAPAGSEEASGPAFVNVSLGD